VWLFQVLQGSHGLISSIAAISVPDQILPFVSGLVSLSALEWRLPQIGRQGLAAVLPVL
jgi:hypothetical protein